MVARAQKHLVLNHPLRLVACLRAAISARALLYGDFVQADILDGRPDDGEATGLSGEDINLIGALAHITLPDSQWHWWSEYAGACAEETHKTSTSALHPPPDYAPLRDSAQRTWL